jgi:creatinine amidohydrolase
MPLTVWNEATREELREILPGSVVLLPTGATEQHGPHLATGHDTFAVTAIARAAAERAGKTTPVVLAPALAFGSSAHHLPFGGTLSLTTETYLHVVRDLVASMIAGGARRIFLLNGHGGNHELNQLVARDAALGQPLDAPVAVAAASYWDLARESIQSDPNLRGLTIPGHAGQFETATMLALDSGRVREPRAERGGPTGAASTIPGARVDVTGLWSSFDGFTDFPYLATAAQGEAILDHVVRDVAEVLVAFAGIDVG